MSPIVERASVSFEAVVVLTEREVLALAKVLEWGADTAADALLVAPSASEAGPFRKDLVGLMERLREGLPPIVRKSRDARDVFTGRLVAIKPEPKS